MLIIGAAQANALMKRTQDDIRRSLAVRLRRNLPDLAGPSPTALERLCAHAIELCIRNGITREGHAYVVAATMLIVGEDLKERARGAPLMKIVEHPRLEEPAKASLLRYHVFFARGIDLGSHE